MHTLIRPVAVGALVVALAGCALTGEPASSPPDEPTETDTPESDAPSGDEGFPIGGVDEESIAALLAAAAAEANATIDQIRVVTAEEVTWPDGAIGCPEPGMAYTQALVPGYRVVLEIDGEERHFHASEGGQFFECDDPQPPAERGADR